MTTNIERERMEVLAQRVEQDAEALQGAARVLSDGMILQALQDLQHSMAALETFINSCDAPELGE